MSIIHKIILYHLAQHNYAFVTTVAKNLVKEDNVLLYWSVQLATYIYSLVQVIIWHCTWLFHIKTVPAETTKWHQRAFQLTRAMSENASTLLWTLVAVHKSMYYIGAPVISNKKKDDLQHVTAATCIINLPNPEMGHEYSNYTLTASCMVIIFPGDVHQPILSQKVL